MTDRTYTRRQLVRASALAGAVGIAGCSGEDDSVVDPDPPTVDDETPIETLEPTASEDDQSVTFRPEELVHDEPDLATVTNQDVVAGREVEFYTNQSDQTLGACLERDHYTRYRSGEDEYANRLQLYVSVPPGETIEDMQAVYNRDFNPPSKPLRPDLNGRELIEGEETTDGIRFRFPVSGEVRDVSPLYEVTNTQTITEDGDLLLPYEELTPNYLAKPVVRRADVTMTTDSETFALLLSYPDVSIDIVDFRTQSKDDGVQLESISVDVTMDSEKPTQLVNLHTDFGYTRSYDYGYRIEAEDFERVDGSGTTRLTRDFTDSQNSVTADTFYERFPMEQESFDVVVGQVAPLARTTLSRDEILN